MRKLFNAIKDGNTLIDLSDDSGINRMIQLVFGSHFSISKIVDTTRPFLFSM